MKETNLTYGAFLTTAPLKRVAKSSVSQNSSSGNTSGSSATSGNATASGASCSAPSGNQAEGPSNSTNKGEAPTNSTQPQNSAGGQNDSTTKPGSCEQSGQQADENDTVPDPAAEAALNLSDAASSLAAAAKAVIEDAGTAVSDGAQVGVGWMFFVYEFVNCS